MKLYFSDRMVQIQKSTVFNRFLTLRIDMYAVSPAPILCTSTSLLPNLPVK